MKNTPSADHVLVDMGVIEDEQTGKSDRRENHCCIFRVVYGQAARGIPKKDRSDPLIDKWEEEEEEVARATEEEKRQNPEKM